jgi:hypothetical protein
MPTGKAVARRRRQCRMPDTQCRRRDAAANCQNGLQPFPMTRVCGFGSSAGGVCNGGEATTRGAFIIAISLIDVSTMAAARGRARRATADSRRGRRVPSSGPDLTRSVLVRIRYAPPRRSMAPESSSCRFGAPTRPRFTICHDGAARADPGRRLRYRLRPEKSVFAAIADDPAREQPKLGGQR